MSASNDTPLGRGLRLGRPGGVPLVLHWSVLGMAVLVMVLLGAGVLPSGAKGHSTATYWLCGGLGAALFIASVAVHELAHAIVARRCGIPVTRMTLRLLGGLTEMSGEPPTPRADAAVAAAGPAASVALVIAYGGIAVSLGTSHVLGVTFLWLASINLILVVLNLLPAAPLDGGRLLRAWLWHRGGDRAAATATAARAGHGVGLVLMGLGALYVLFGWLDGLWLLLVGWFIMSSADAERMAVHVERLSGLHVTELMRPVHRTAFVSAAAQDFLDSLMPEDAGEPGYAVVDVDGRLAGVVTVADLAAATARYGHEVQLRDVIARHPDVLAVSDGALVTDVLTPMRRRAGRRGGLAVVVDGQQHPLGLLTDADLVRAAQLASLQSTRS